MKFVSPQIQNLIQSCQDYFEGNRAQSFSDFASKALARTGQNISISDCDHFFETTPRSIQTFSDHCFSSLDRTLYSDVNFCLDYYLWLGQDTSIHDHHFEGAFTVLEGQNTEVFFDYKPSGCSTHANVLDFGTLIPKQQVSLNRGDVSTIVKGKSHIHHVVRRSKKSATLCLRTQSDRSSLLHSYFYSGARVLAPSLDVVPRRVFNQISSGFSSQLSQKQWFDLTHEARSCASAEMFQSWLLMNYMTRSRDLNSNFPIVAVDELKLQFPLGELLKKLDGHLRVLEKISTWKS